jgi:hypothetical protein
MGPLIRVAVITHPPLASLLIAKGHFKSMSGTNTAPVPIVLSIDITSQMEPSFISEKYNFWVENTAMY